MNTIYFSKKIQKEEKFFFQKPGLNKNIFFFIIYFYNYFFINPKTGHVVLGINDGTASVRKNIDNLSEEIASLEEPREWIEVIRYSPNEELLAVGCHDNFIYIYETKNYKLKTVLKGKIKH